MPDLLRLVHGNTSGIKRLVDEFRLYWKKKGQQGTVEEGLQSLNKEEQMEVGEVPAGPDALPPVVPPTQSPSTSVPPISAPASEGPPTSAPVRVQEDNDSSDKVNNEDEYTISKRQMEIRIAAIAVREKRSLFKKVCWYVHDSILKQYNLEDLPVPTTWQYITIPNKRDSLNPDSLNNSGRKTPNSKMFALLASPQQFSPGESRPDKIETLKLTSDQRSIKFFTKTKEPTPKDPSKPELPASTFGSLRVNQVPTPEPMEDDCQIVRLELSPQQKNNNQQSMTFFAQLKEATMNNSISEVTSSENGSPQMKASVETCAKPVTIHQNCPIIIPSRPQIKAGNLSHNNISSVQKMAEANDKATEGSRDPDVILLD